MNFLEFFVWGAWLISLGGYMFNVLHFTGTQIGSIYGDKLGGSNEKAYYKKRVRDETGLPVQLAGGHIDSHVNNPNESLGQWRGGTQRPVCAFSPQRLPKGPNITATQGWHDIPTCVESGLNIPQFQQPRTVWLPGKVTPDQAAFYIDLMKKVQATPEWKEYIERTSQTDTFLTGEAFSKFIKDDIERTHKVAADENWLIAN